MMARVGLLFVLAATANAVHNVTEEDLLEDVMNVTGRKSKTEQYYGTRKNVRGTWWGPQTDRGGCQMPMTQYRYEDAVALGEWPSLGKTKISHEICGKAVEVNCGHGPVKAIIASSCNQGTPSCGVDMVGRTWKKATNGKIPGISPCTVKLLKQRVMKGKKKRCFHRPDSDSHQYYQSVGLFNSRHRIVKSARLANSDGKWNGGSSGYFDFRYKGVKFTKNSALTFTYMDGSKHKMKLGGCEASFGKVKIWK